MPLFQGLAGGSLFRVRARSSSRRGALTVMSAFLLVLMLVLVAFAVDIGYMCLARTQLQSAADAGALAGAARLGEGKHAARKAVDEFIQLNSPDKSPQVVIDFGYWDRNVRTFDSKGSPINAIQVDVETPEMPTFFGRALGHTSFESRAEAIARVRPRDIMLVLDYSGSMNEKKKIEQLKEAVSLFLRILEFTSEIDRVGFVRYSTFGELEIPLTHDLAAVEKAALAPKANGWTNIGEGMEKGRLQLLQQGRPDAKKMMVIMTDGHVNRPAHGSPRGYVIDEAYKSAGAKIELNTVSFGDDADETLMDEVATIGRGAFFAVMGTVHECEKELRQAFQEIAIRKPVLLVD